MEENMVTMQNYKRLARLLQYQQAGINVSKAIMDNETDRAREIIRQHDQATATNSPRARG